MSRLDMGPDEFEKVLENSCKVIEGTLYAHGIELMDLYKRDGSVTVSLKLELDEGSVGVKGAVGISFVKARVNEKALFAMNPRQADLPGTADGKG